MKSYHCKSKSKSPKHDCNYHFETRELLLEMESPELMEANALQCHISASHIHSQRKTVLTSTASWWVLVASWAKRRINPLSIETSPRVLAKQGSQCIYVTTFVNSIYSSTKEIHMNNLKLNLCQWSKKKGHEEAEMWCRVSSATIEGCAWELNSSWTNDKVLHRQMSSSWTNGKASPLTF